MDWDIKPYVGVGEVRFGMSPAQVANYIGQPTLVEKREPWDRYEAREYGSPFFYYDDKGLGEMEFPANFAALTLEGVRVFEDPTAFLKLVSRLDPKLVETFGTTISLGLGIAFGEFLPGSYEPNRSVTQFRRGVWSAEECASFDPVDYSGL